MDLSSPNIPIAEKMTGSERMPSATPQALAAAIAECIDAGARVLNLRLALAQPSNNGEHRLEEALNLAARRSVMVVAAAGNQGTLGSSVMTRHPCPFGAPFTKRSKCCSPFRRPAAAVVKNCETNLSRTLQRQPLTLSYRRAILKFSRSVRFVGKMRRRHWQLNRPENAKCGDG